MSVTGDPVSQLSAVRIDGRHLGRRDSTVTFHFFWMRNSVVRLIGCFVALRLEFMLTGLHFLPTNAFVVESGFGAVASLGQVVFCHKTVAGSVDHSLNQTINSYGKIKVIITVVFETGSWNCFCLKVSSRPSFVVDIGIVGLSKPMVL